MSESSAEPNLETSLLQRIRRWRDAFPILILIDALRVAGSPIWISLSWLAVVVSSLVARGTVALDLQPTSVFANWISPRLAIDTATTWLTAAGIEEMLRFALAGWLWAIPAAMLARSGACYAIGRDQQRIGADARFVGCRAIALSTAGLLPAACILGISIPMVLLGLLSRIPAAGRAIAEVGGLFLVPIAIVAGLVAAGSIAAIPLAWTAIAVEKRCDAFDALSRGFEYVYRRPIHLALYLTVGWLLIAVVSILATIVARGASAVASSAFAVGSGGGELPLVIRIVLANLVPAIQLAAVWGLVGAGYLLLRRDACDQEIEDMAFEETDTERRSLPTLRSM